MGKFLDAEGLATLWELIGDEHGNPTNHYTWERQSYIAPTYTQALVEYPYLINTEYYVYADIADSFKVLDSGEVALINATTDQTVTSYSKFLGKYFKITGAFYGGDIKLNVVYYCPPDATFTSQYSGGAYYWKASVLYSINGSAASFGDTEFVDSKDANAFPTGVSGDYVYRALGRLGEKLQIATGSYVGTGYGGKKYPLSLTFNFKPEMVIVYKDSTGLRPAGSSSYWYQDCGIWLPHNHEEYAFYNKSDYGYCEWEFDDTTNTLTWSHYYSGAPNGGENATYAAACLNTSGATYHYIAIGQ